MTSLPRKEHGFLTSWTPKRKDSTLLKEIETSAYFKKEESVMEQYTMQPERISDGSARCATRGHPKPKTGLPGFGLAGEAPTKRA